MSEKPILFNTEMVRAILSGQKTQTRRIVKLPDEIKPYRVAPSEEHLDTLDCWEFLYGAYSGSAVLDLFHTAKAPYAIGDFLYVRETWNGIKLGPKGKETTTYWYRADEDDDRLNPDDKWRPSIHMPKEAARIWLKVTNVRCERLQDISFADIRAEGMDMDEWYEYDEWQHSVGDGMGDEVPVIFENPYHFFGSRVWDSTMGSLEKYKKYGWDANPFVWVIEFERVEVPKCS